MKQEPYTLEPHNFKTWKKIAWPICVKCGLIALKNPLTEWAMKQGCNHKDHPSYESQRMKQTKLFD